VGLVERVLRMRDAAVCSCRWALVLDHHSLELGAQMGTVCEGSEDGVGQPFEGGVLTASYYVFSRCWAAGLHRPG